MNNIENNPGIYINPNNIPKEQSETKPEKYEHTTEDGRYYFCDYEIYENAQKEGRHKLLLLDPPQMVFFNEKELEIFNKINPTRSQLNKTLKAFSNPNKKEYKKNDKRRKRNKMAKATRQKNRR